MTPYDAAMVGVILAGMVWGAFKGVTWQVASLASLILGYVASHTLSTQLAPYFPGEPVVARLLAMLTIYLVVSGGIFLVAWMIRTTLRKLRFEAYDRHLGMLLGGTEGALLGVVGTLFVVSLAPQSRGPIFSSPSGKVVKTVMAALGPVLPSEAREELAPFLAPIDATAAQREATSTSLPNPLGIDLPAARPGSGDPTAQSPSLVELITDGENKLGKAIADEATKELQQATGGSVNGRTIDRR